MKNIKLTLLKFAPIVLVLILVGWGMSSVAEDDIKSATANFSVLGIVSDISENDIEIKDAKGSDKSGKTSYDLNIDHLESMQTSAYIPLNFTDIKVGDKIIAQGLTNGNTFFIKRIISFTSTPTPVDLEVASTTVATSTATTTELSEDISTTTATTSNTVDSIESVSTTTTDDMSTSTIISDIVATTSTSTTEESASTTTSVLETVVDVVEQIVDIVTDTVQGIVDVVVGNDAPADVQNNISNDTPIVIPENTPVNTTE